MSHTFTRKLLSGTLFLSALLPFSFVPAQAASEAQSAIQEVTAYQGLAQIKRTLRFTASQAGNYPVRIPNLPIRLIRDSLNIQGNSKANVSIQHFQLIAPPAFEKPTLTPREKELTAAVKSLKERIDQLSTRKELNRVHRDFMKLFAKQMQQSTQEDEELSIRAWEQALQFTLAQQKEILNTRESIEDLKKPLQQEYNRLTQALRQYKRHHPQTQDAEVQLHFKSPGTATLTMSYLVPNVRWSPMYEARLKGDLLDLRYGGEIWQQSGENWDNVQLELSTATPLLNQRSPEPFQWRVGAYSPKFAGAKKAVRRSAPAPAMSNMMPSPIMEDAVAEPEMSTEQSLVSDHGIALAFRLPGSQNFDSSNTARQVTMATRQIKVDTSYKIIPRQSTQAFLEVNLTNSTGLPLLPGKMRSYVEDSFTGVQPVDLIRPEQEARLSFGVDRNIKVKWLELERKEAQAGVLGDKKQTTVVYQAEVTNYKKEAVKLRILEPRPVSANKDIKIEWLKGEPQVSKITDEKLRIWELEAKPWEKKTIRMTYRITYPKDVQLSF